MSEVAMSRTIGIRGPGSINGVIRVPGDKSISHRVAMLASVASGTSVIAGFASSADCHTTLDCINRLGIHTEKFEDRIVIHGRGLRGYRAAEGRALLDAGNSGSTIRMLSGLLAGQSFTSVIEGDESLSRRPMARIIEPLTLMGARVEARRGRFPPIQIHGGRLDSISFESRVASAQVKTGVLFAGLLAEGRTSFREPVLSRDHTELMLPQFGVALEITDMETGRRLSVEGGKELEPVEYQVPGDASSAAYFIAAATVLQGSELRLSGVNLNPTRTAFVDVLNRLGASIRLENQNRRHGEEVGDVFVKSSRLACMGGVLKLSGEIIPNLIDEIPILAVACTQVEGRVEIREARELRYKESDRIKTVIEGLRAMGVEVEEFEDGFALNGPQRLSGGRIETAGDHRIAMAFSVAGLIATGRSEIVGAESAAVSFPEFYDLLSSLTGQTMTEQPS